MDHPVTAPPRSYAALISASVLAVLSLAVAVEHGLFFGNGDLPTMASIPLGIAGLVVLGHALYMTGQWSQPAWLRFAPLAVCVATLLILIYVPFSRFGADWDFAAHRGAREALAEHIAATWLGGDADEVPLGAPPPLLSRDDNKAGVARCGQATCVLFFTWQRTNFQASEGYLYMPPGGDLAKFYWYGRYNAVRPLGGRWWYVREQ